MVQRLEQTSTDLTSVILEWLARIKFWKPWPTSSTFVTINVSKWWIRASSSTRVCSVANGNKYASITYEALEKLNLARAILAVGIEFIIHVETAVTTIKLELKIVTIIITNTVAYSRHVFLYCQFLIAQSDSYARRCRICVDFEKSFISYLCLHAAT